MAYTLACRDLGKDCDFVARGESEKGVIDEATKHLKLEHGYTTYQLDFPENIEWVKKAIKK